MNIFIHGDTTLNILVDKDLLVENLKKIIEDQYFISAEQQKLYFNTEQLINNNYLSDYKISNGDILNLNFDILGGTGDSKRYKKSTSKFRWKWKKKRTRRLQRKRRKMRMRAR